MDDSRHAPLKIYWAVGKTDANALTVGDERSEALILLQYNNLIAPLFEIKS